MSFLGTGVSILRLSACSTTSPEGSKPWEKVWFESLGRRRGGMDLIPREMSYYVRGIAELWPSWLNIFISYVFYRGPVCQFCDSPHVVRLLPRDQNHEKKYGLYHSGDVGVVWFWFLGRCRTTCGESQIYDQCGWITSDLMSFIEDRCVNSAIPRM